MLVCARCSTFIPKALNRCPACAEQRPSIKRGLRGALAIAGGSLFAMTLSACYGTAYSDYDGATYTPPDSGARDGATSHDSAALSCADGSVDHDSDGFCPPADCNDDDFTTFPGAPDSLGDGVDTNCDGVR